MEVLDECTAALDDIKFKKDITWVEYKISDDKKSICVASVVKKSEVSGEKVGYEEFVRRLDAKTPRYYVFSFSYTLPDGGERDKLVFIPW